MRSPGPSGRRGPRGRSGGSRRTAGCRCSGAPRPVRRCRPRAPGRCVPNSPIRPRSSRAAPSTAWAGSSGFTPRPRAVRRHQLHQALRAGRADGAGVEAGLLLAPPRRAGSAGRRTSAAAPVNSVGVRRGAGRPCREPATDRATSRPRSREHPADRGGGLVDVGDLHVLAGPRRLDHLAVADVDRDVVHRACRRPGGRRAGPRRGWRPGCRRWPAGRRRGAGRSRGSCRRADQARAVQPRRRVGAAPDVGHAEVLLGLGDDRLAARDGAAWWPRRSTSVAAAASPAAPVAPASALANAALRGGAGRGARREQGDLGLDLLDPAGDVGDAHAAASRGRAASSWVARSSSSWASWRRALLGARLGATLQEQARPRAACWRSCCQRAGGLVGDQAAAPRAAARRPRPAAARARRAGATCATNVGGRPASKDGRGRRDARARRASSRLAGVRTAVERLLQADPAVLLADVADAARRRRSARSSCGGAHAAPPGRAASARCRRRRWASSTACRRKSLIRGISASARSASGVAAGGVGADLDQLADVAVRGEQPAQPVAASPRCSGVVTAVATPGDRLEHVDAREVARRWRAAGRARRGRRGWSGRCRRSGPACRRPRRARCRGR